MPSPADDERTMFAGTAAIVILLLLAGVHLYWAAGGSAGKDAAIPVANGQPVIKPSALGTMTVAVGLCAMAAVMVLRIGWFDLPALPGDGVLVKSVAWLIAAVFALRAIGDFRYVGFFKRLSDSRFARLDTMVYSPLCACLALLVGISSSR